LSLDFGLKEFGPGEIRSAVTSELHPSTIVPTYGAGRAGVLDTEERLKRYRRYVYEAGALDHPGKGQARVIDKDNWIIGIFLFFLTFRLKVGVNNRLPAEKFVFMCAPVKQEISAI